MWIAIVSPLLAIAAGTLLALLGGANPRALLPIRSFALIAVLLAGFACISAIVTMQFAVHRAVVKVPDLKGLPVDAATTPQGTERVLHLSSSQSPGWACPNSRQSGRIETLPSRQQ